MRLSIRAALTAAGILGASLALASCGGHRKQSASQRPAPRLVAAPVMPGSEVTAPAAAASTAASVWNLRAGLNVAALSCRGQGRQPVAAPYAAMLTRHRALLADAYRREQGRQGAQAFDRQQTRLYNIFSNQASAPHFCASANAIAQRVNGLPSAEFAAAAPRMLGALQTALLARR